MSTVDYFLKCCNRKPILEYSLVLYLCFLVFQQYLKHQAHPYFGRVDETLAIVFSFFLDRKSVV